MSINWIFCIGNMFRLLIFVLLTRAGHLSDVVEQLSPGITVNRVDQPRIWDAFNRPICSEFFGSRGYQIKAEASSSSVGGRNVTDLSHCNVTDERMREIEFWNRERFHIRLKQKFPLSRRKYIESEALVCYDLDLSERWKIILKKDIFTGFVFKVSTDSKHVALDALMDVYYVVPVIRDDSTTPTKYLLRYYTNFRNTDRKKKRRRRLETQFHDSLKKLVRGAKDPLCSLNEVLQFRLCSIGADALYKSYGKDYKYTFYRRGEDDYLFEKPFENFYHHRENSCPKITVDFKDEGFVTGLEHRALFCDVTIQNLKQQFFLSHDIKSRIGMFIITKKKKKFIIKNLLEVQLFYRLRMRDFDVIYSDEILKKFEEAIVA